MFATTLSDDLGHEIGPEDIVFYVPNANLGIMTAPAIADMLDEARDSAKDGDYSARFGHEAVMHECEISYTVADNLPKRGSRPLCQVKCSSSGSVGMGISKERTPYGRV